MSAPARKQMRNVLYSNIIYDAMDMQHYIAFINLSDPAVSKAIEVLKQ